MSMQNIRKLNYVIDKSFHGRTIEAFLHSKGYTASLLSYLKRVEFQEDGRKRFGIEKNGKWAFTVDILSEGDTLEISILEEDTKESAAPFSHPLEIVYEDEDLLPVFPVILIPDITEILLQEPYYIITRKKEGFLPLSAAWFTAWI